MAKFESGDIVIVDWRDALPKEANKHRTAVVIEDSFLFDDLYPNVILVPLTEDARLVVQALSVRIEPTQENGCSRTCFAVSPLVTATSKARVRATGARVTPDQLRQVRRQVAEAIGLA